ncbi:hypothetical protein H6A65_16430 [Mediterraneibacter glycyrrhizinilyticus]|uniref:hypothetical protein n=1 Tax=Mediterraneibacter glycyrrhizinilyticus TaxID=342942 RepID=UPI001961377E|nr:hypothetical protein [Mediterraneibacter glycyrrhizinilyticus]MBM6753048.1 hypothetical protein [Mediterraneibacter glycyrrhizinilyticus]
MRQQYEKIMQDISRHKDFGQRNPVDIGIELGYPEQAIVEMFQFISEKELIAETQKKTNQDKKERQIIRLYYDGKDICKKCADMIGIKKYIELDNYLVYSDENYKLVKISKATGEKSSVGLEADIDKCKGWGEWIYYYVSVDTMLELFRFNIETAYTEQIEFEKEVCVDFQMNDEYLIYFVDDDSTLMCFNLIDETTQTIKTNEGVSYGEQFYLVGDKIYCNLRDALHEYDLKEEKDTILQEEIDDQYVNEFLQRSYGRGSTSFFGNKLYTVSSILGYDGEPGICICDMDSPESLEIINFPENSEMMSGYGKVCCVTEDDEAILSCYDIMTNTTTIIMKNCPVVWSYEKGGVFKKKVYACMTSDMQVVGKWLYFARNDLEDTIGCISLE